MDARQKLTKDYKRCETHMHPPLETSAKKMNGIKLQIIVIFLSPRGIALPTIAWSYQKIELDLNTYIFMINLYTKFFPVYVTSAAKIHGNCK